MGGELTKIMSGVLYFDEDGAWFSVIINLMKITIAGKINFSPMRQKNVCQIPHQRYKMLISHHVFPD